MSEEVKEAIRLCNNVIENADYMEYEYMKEYKKSSIDILVKEIERLNKENEELKKIQCTFLGTGCKQEIERLKIRISKQRQANKKLQEKYDLVHSIIKEVREKLEYLLTHDKVEINGTIYLKQEADDFITNYILEILDKENE